MFSRLLAASLVVGLLVGQVAAQDEYWSVSLQEDAYQLVLWDDTDRVGLSVDCFHRNGADLVYLNLWDGDFFSTRHDAFRDGQVAVGFDDERSAVYAGQLNTNELLFFRSNSSPVDFVARMARHSTLHVGVTVAPDGFLDLQFDLLRARDAIRLLSACVAGPLVGGAAESPDDVAAERGRTPRSQPHPSGSSAPQSIPGSGPFGRTSADAGYVRDAERTEQEQTTAAHQEALDWIERTEADQAAAREWLETALQFAESMYAFADCGSSAAGPCDCLMDASMFVQAADDPRKQEFIAHMTAISRAEGRPMPMADEWERLLSFASRIVQLC